jgi:hypothetical protein
MVISCNECEHVAGFIEKKDFLVLDLCRRPSPRHQSCRPRPSGRLASRAIDGDKCRSVTRSAEPAGEKEEGGANLRLIGADRILCAEKQPFSLRAKPAGTLLACANCGIPRRFPVSTRTIRELFSCVTIPTADTT